jgi:hypothetical protein
MERTGRANARSLSSGGASRRPASKLWRHSPMCNCTSEDAPFGAGPESILPVVVMDSGLASSTRPGMTELASGSRLRVSANLLKRINVIPPVQSPLQKYFRFHAPQITSRTFRIPPHRGAYRDRHGRGVRMRWTRQRFARDGIAGWVGERPVSDQQRADERCCSVRRSRVVLTPRRWRQVRGVKSARPGLDKAYPWTTVAKEPGHRGEHEGNR